MKMRAGPHQLAVAETSFAARTQCHQAGEEPTHSRSVVETPPAEEGRHLEETGTFLETAAIQPEDREEEAERKFAMVREA